MHTAAAAFASLLGLSFVAGCGANPVALGTSSEVLWWTDHESGDLGDWSTTNPYPGFSWMIAGEVNVAEGPAHSGRYAMQNTITTHGKGAGVSAAVAQKSGLPQEAYYSAWFYLPAPAPRPTEYIMIFKLRSRTVPSEAATEVEVWDLELGRRSDGRLALALFNHLNMSGTPYDAGPVVPENEWFHIEAFLRAAPDASGRLELWMNGNPVLLSISGVTMPSTFVEWAVGAVSEEMTPSTGTILVDDAAISTLRLGPTAPFWRGL